MAVGASLDFLKYSLKLVGYGLCKALGHMIGFTVIVPQLVPHQDAEQQLPDSRAGLKANAWIARRDAPLQTQPPGALAGLTFAVKDNMDVAT